MTDTASLHPLAAVLGLALVLAALALLRAAWKRRSGGPRAPLIVGGWACALAAAPAWALAGGPDRGIAIGVTVFALCAALVVGLGLRDGLAPRRAASARNGEARAAEIDAARLAAVKLDRAHLRVLAVLLLAGPTSFLAAAALGMAGFLALPGAAADRLATAAYLTPLAWGGLAAWAVSDPNLIRKSVGVVGIGLIGGLLTAALA